jgi:glycyl-tRNA synthetase beta chain
MTDMVGEFPNLQGTMGKYYAQHSKEAPEVANAIEEQYHPRFAGDQLPQTVSGRVLAIADKLDTLAGIFAIGQIPSGDKDPFGLRRAALGVLRIMVECKLDLDLSELVVQALQNYQGTVDIKDTAKVAHSLYQFIMERLRTYYADKGIVAEVFESVMSQRPANPYDFDRRILAVTAFKQLPEAESLAVANKRIANILKKAVGEYEKHKLDNKLLIEPAEKTLAAELSKMEKAVSPLLAKREYESALAKMAGLRQSVDTFFDDVMVMTDDKAQRQNRLALLAQLRGLFLKVADISQLHLG